MQLVQNAVQKGCMMTDGRIVIDSIMIKHVYKMVGSLCTLSGFVRLETTSQEAGYTSDFMPMDSSSARQEVIRTESEIDGEEVRREKREV